MEQINVTITSCTSTQGILYLLFLVPSAKIFVVNSQFKSSNN